MWVEEFSMCMKIPRYGVDMMVYVKQVKMTEVELSVAYGFVSCMQMVWSVILQGKIVMGMSMTMLKERVVLGNVRGMKEVGLMKVRDEMSENTNFGMDRLYITNFGMDRLYIYTTLKREGEGRESAFSFLLSSSLSAMIFLESPGECFSLSLIDKFDRVVDMLVEGDGMVTSFDENVIENVGSPEPGFLSPFGVW
ncbi:hypothetical protein AgCh_024129 [Apium graveolens]